ncbi:unnamed protein product [Dracunculus medinensis]|uniref:G_PROTEIN_RECEP_F1_2 domain-containing protein n=1 Tax=Dracunculus medinensis TaxID=318479 RepID=A0A0N4U4Z2_DRAME|nr:unnamed protein product [Dracunculus medinensis]
MIRVSKKEDLTIYWEFSRYLDFWSHLTFHEMCDNYEIFNNFSTEWQEQYVHWKKATFYFGSIGTAINIILLILLISLEGYRRFPEYVYLGIGDFCATVGLMFRGTDRLQLFQMIRSTGTACRQTSITCAQKAYIWLRLVGSLLPALILVIIGFEKLSCVLWPAWYKRHAENKGKKITICVTLYLTFNILAASVLVIVNENSNVKISCGRKETFSKPFMLYVYMIEILGYLTAFILNINAYLRLLRLTNLRDAENLIRKAKISLILAFFSCILVAIPGIFNMINAVMDLKKVNVREAALCLASINASMNIFLYLCLKGEIYQRLHYKLRTQKNRIVAIKTELSKTSEKIRKTCLR